MLPTLGTIQIKSVGEAWDKHEGQEGCQSRKKRKTSACVTIAQERKPSYELVLATGNP